MTRDMNVPRSLSFSGVVKAGRMEILNWSVKELDLLVENVGLQGSPSFVSEMFTQESKREVRFLSGTRVEIADQLVRLFTEAGVI